jgi:outer membrane lipoprotein-sorting protein
MKKFKISVVLLMAFASLSFADEMSGEQVISNVYNRPSSNDLQANLTMELKNSQGNTRVREIKQFVKAIPEGEKKIMYFVAPADVKNTSFMNWSYDDASKSDDQWIYLPALKKIKRISSDSKSDSFMGSDFTYDDLGDRALSDDTHSIIREETLDKKDCYVVESVSKQDNYMYSRTLTWVEKGSWIGIKKEFYDEDDELLKVLRVLASETLDGVIIITNTTMENVQNGHSTTMTLKDILVNKGLDDSLFTERMMKRAPR